MGSHIPKQIQPVKYNELGELELIDVPFDTNKYITEGILTSVDVLGSISNKKGVSTVYDTSVTVVLSTTDATSYTLSGDFVGSPIAGSIDAGFTEVDLVLVAGAGRKDVELILPNSFGGSSMYSTYFNLSSDVVDQEVDTYIGIDAEYTKHWKSNKCDVSSMSTVYKYDGDGIDDIVTGTVYILDEGTYTTNGGLLLGECTAII